MGIKPVGNTVYLSTSNTSHSAVVVGNDVTDGAVSKAAFLNTGNATVFVTVAANVTIGGNMAPPAAASVAPSDGAGTGARITLPPGMLFPQVFDTPLMPVSVTAIGSAAGPSSIYITPCEETK